MEKFSTLRKILKLEEISKLWKKFSTEEKIPNLGEIS